MPCVSSVITCLDGFWDWLHSTQMLTDSRIRWSWQFKRIQRNKIQSGPNINLTILCYIKLTDQPDWLAKTLDDATNKSSF